LIGRTIGHYEVIAKIGEGGMGEVYRARDSRLDREVAIKVLPPEFAKDPERLARFRREARVLASLNHTHIAALHGLEESEGEVFLAMELVAGEDLSERLQRGPIELDEALDLARQFAEGLEAAHEQNIVHRDLKPANLKVTPDGQLKILDFGLARAYLGDQGEAENLDHSPTITAALTGHGVILGTAAYMSPEQARGRKVDQRSDIWAFGAILFEMLGGERLFQGETISDTMAAVLRADPPWDQLPTDTPKGVRRLIERCLERDARRRLRDIGEARVRLERWRDEPDSVHESYVSGVSIEAAEPRRGISVPWVMCGIALLMASFFGWQLTTRDAPPPRLMSFEIDVDEEHNLVSAGTRAVISPDGTWMAWNTASGVYLREIARPETRLLEGTDGAFAVCFSPDSQWLAFSGRGQLQRVSVSGGTPIAICDLVTPRGLAWVDDTTIVFSPSISAGLFKVSLSDGTKTAATELDHPRKERSHRWPTVVPDQRAVLFECQFLGKDYDASDIQILDLDTGERKTVHRGGAAPLATNQGQLLFVRGNSLFAVEFDAPQGTTTGLPIPVLDNLTSSVGNQEDDDGSAQFAVDNRGTLLYLDNGGLGSGLSRMAWFDVQTGETTPFGPSAQHSALRLSPTGNKVIVSRTRDGDENLYAHDLQTGTETMVTHRRSVEYVGAWSPDSKVFYWSQNSDAGDRFEIWRRPIDGTSPPEFVVASPTEAGVWPEDISPDGRYLMCTAWLGANLRDFLLLDLEDIDAGFTAFAPSDRNHTVLRWFGQDHVIYCQGLEIGSLMMRRFPDTGALWTLPDVETGFFEAVPNFGLDAAIVLGPEGSYRFPVSLEGGSVQIGQPDLLHTWTMEEKNRFSLLIPHPDGNRYLGLVSDDPQGTLSSPSLVIVTGWTQDVARRLVAGR
jgi:serine/threonine-protein kinase